MKNRNRFLWMTLFILIFLLSQDYLFVSWEGKPAVLGFPGWIGWFAFVHVLFIAAFYFFAKKYWNE
jgi:cation transport ATPase